VVPAWLVEKPKEKGSTLEELRIETGGSPEKAGVAPACMVYFLSNEFMAPANQVVQEETSLDINEDE
jgi:hypothetical protein